MKDPVQTRHRQAFRFVRQEGGARLEIPARLPGADVVGVTTPLDQPHDTHCFGFNPAFEPKVIPSP